MDLVLLLLALALIGVVAAVAVGRIRGGLEPAPVNRAEVLLPQGPVLARDLAGIEFTVAVRGYRMDEVDAVLDRLARELGERDAELGELRRRTGAAQTGRPAGPGTG